MVSEMRSVLPRIGMLVLLLSTLFGVGARASTYTYDQTLTPPQVWCYRPTVCTFSVADAVAPTTDGTLSVLGSGDINEYSDYVPVQLEGSGIGTLWGFNRYCVGPGGSYTFDGCVDTMTVPLNALLAAWTDGTLAFQFVIQGTVGGVIFENLRLTYGTETPPNPVPAPGTLGLLALGLAALGCARRPRKTANPSPSVSEI